MSFNNIKILDRQFFATGTLVIKQGTEGSRAFFIESGKVEVFFTNPDGSETKLAEIGPGGIFGEMALIAEGKRTASVRTLTESILIIISAHELRTAMGSSDNLQKKLIQMMSDRLKDTHGKLSGKGDIDNGITKDIATSLLEKLKAQAKDDDGA